MGKEVKFKSVINWYNELEDKKRNRILNLIQVDGIFRLDDNEIEMIKGMFQFVCKEIENGIDEEKIINKLLKNGIEKDDAEIFVEYASVNKGEMTASELINNMSIDKYNKILCFVVNKIHLYREINFIPFEEFIEECDFKNEIEAKIVLKLLNTYINRIIERDMTIENIVDKLTKVNNVNQDYISLFKSIITENLNELRMASLMFKLTKVEAYIDEIYNEKYELDDKEEI